MSQTINSCLIVRLRRSAKCAEHAVSWDTGRPKGSLSFRNALIPGCSLTGLGNVSTSRPRYCGICGDCSEQTTLQWQAEPQCIRALRAVGSRTNIQARSNAAIKCPLCVTPRCHTWAASKAHELSPLASAASSPSPGKRIFHNAAWSGGGGATPSGF